VFLIGYVALKDPSQVKREWWTVFWRREDCYRGFWILRWI